MMTDQELLSFPLSDLGHAERLVALHHHHLRYVIEQKRWLYWDSHRWSADPPGQVFEWAKGSLRRVVPAASKLGWTANDIRKLDHSIRGSENRLPAIVTAASHDRRVQIHASAFDRDPWMLNTPNGVIDLQTGALLEARPEYFCTLSTGVRYNPAAGCPIYDRTVSEMFYEEPMRAYIRRISGYALTGIVSEKTHFILIGEGDNGKTTLLRAWRHTSGDYGGQVQIDSLLSHSRSDNNRNSDLASLFGKRLVTTSEPSSEARLNESTMKQLASLDSIKVRRLFENPITFDLAAKLFIDANDAPRIEASPSTFSRFRIIQFNIRIPAERMDRFLSDRLERESEGILTSRVQGCLEWQTDGLAAPSSAEFPQQRWQTEMDDWQDFGAAHLEFHGDGRETSAVLWGNARMWAKDNGVAATTPAPFWKYLRRHGAMPCSHHGQSRFWIGVQLTRPFISTNGRH